MAKMALDRSAVAKRLQATVKGRARGKKLAELTSVTESATSKWLSGKAVPDIEHLALVAQEYGATLDWLILGQVHEDSDSMVPMPREFDRKGAKLPIKMDKELLTALGAGDCGNVFSFTASGHSMAPTVGHGDLIVYERGLPPTHGKMFLTKTAAGVRIRRLDLSAKGKIILRADNEAFDEMEAISKKDINTDRLMLIGQVIAVIKKA